MKRCEHWQASGSPSGGLCGLGKFGGAPSFGCCARCVVAPLEAREWAATQAGRPMPEPTAADMVRDFAGAMARWVASGFQVVDKEVFLARRSACMECPYWDGEARGGIGKCEKCGCSRLKWHLPKSKCPIGVWSEVDIQSQK